MRPDYQKVINLDRLKYMSLVDMNRIKRNSILNLFLTVGVKAFCEAGPQLWKNRPILIKLCSSLDEFEDVLKILIFVTCKEYEK